MKSFQKQAFSNSQSLAQTSMIAVQSPFRAVGIPATEYADGQYVVRFARNAEEVESALRLQFEVFNLELGEGLESSHITGLDEDRFDAVCHHLIVVEKETGAVSDFYCAGEFQLENLPPEVLNQSLESERRLSGGAAHRARRRFSPKSVRDEYVCETENSLDENEDADWHLPKLFLT